MKKVLAIFFAAIALNACSSSTENSETPAAEAEGIKQSSEYNAENITGNWKLFKKEGKDGKVIASEDHFFEFKGQNSVAIKTTGSNKEATWYTVDGADAQNKPIRYLIIEPVSEEGSTENNNKTFYVLLLLEEKNLILLDERNRTSYYQKY